MKLEWKDVHEGGKADRRVKFLRRMAIKLFQFCKKYGFDYAEVYYIATVDDNATLNIRAKNGEDSVVNSYSFVKWHGEEIK